MSLSELASHMDYNAYDYHSYRQQQISMYQNNPAAEQHHVHHHHPQQQQHSMHQQQWFSYTTSAQINDASYSYYTNAGYNTTNFPTSNNSTSGGTASGTGSNPQQDYAMGFNNYGGYGAAASHHPSYCI